MKTDCRNSHYPFGLILKTSAGILPRIPRKFSSGFLRKLSKEIFRQLFLDSSRKCSKIPAETNPRTLLGMRTKNFSSNCCRKPERIFDDILGRIPEIPSKEIPQISVEEFLERILVRVFKHLQKNSWTKFWKNFRRNSRTNSDIHLQTSAKNSL